MADGCVLERRLSLTALLSTPPRQLLLGAKSFLAVPPVVHTVRLFVSRELTWHLLANKQEPRLPTGL